MSKKIIITLVTLGVILGAGLGVLIWWLIRADELYETIRLEGKGIGDVKYTAAYTRISDQGNMFWWFYPTLSASPTSRPVLMWLHGATGTPPSFLANFRMFGPYDNNISRRNDSWVNDYNLLFVDAPLGTGFSSIVSKNTDDFPDIEQNVEHLLRTLQSFYSLHEEYNNSPIYICGQGDGSQLALSLAIRLSEEKDISGNFKGVILGNPIVSPALVLTKLGFYLEELGYIDEKGRAAIKNLSNTITDLVSSEEYESAFNHFISLGSFINENAGAVAVNLDHIVEKMTRLPNQDYFGEMSYIESEFNMKNNMNDFMNNVVAPALGIEDSVKYDGRRDDAIHAFKKTYMKPNVDKVEHILKNTNLSISIYNGNLDAVSNTPGQLEWINHLEWSGQSDFLNKTRETLIFNNIIEGYFRESERLRFYWINVAGLLVPYDNSIGIRRALNRIVN
ncbi:retinoid-inducible serine carboxypeptidase-like [Vanessa atalanta]|uniref:retinoid-inducible serine carboxypeptidase-like n=1 Tax=Vanessa atalanta TaxID=42275 RepID=UPI001FCDB281|nr:retinoid-inducible serine carboxypeptidase-like [Vanessa atalanta]